MLTKDGKSLYICASDDDRSRCWTWPPARSSRSALGPDPSIHHRTRGNPVYVANEDDTLVTVIDLETNEVLSQIRSGSSPRDGRQPRRRLGGHHVETTNMVHLIDTTRQQDRRQHAGRIRRPRFVEFSPDGSLAVGFMSEIGGTVTILERRLAAERSSRP